MAVGKNKRLMKGRKGQKKKVVDPFTRKEWYDIKAPATFPNRIAGKTPVNKTQGTKISSDSLKGRVFEVNLADLKGDEDLAFRKIRLCCEEVEGNSCLTNFHGMDLTRDKLCSLIKKKQTLIEAWVDIKTTDGYTMRLFAIGFTTKANKDHLRKTWYAQSGQVRAIRKKMVEVINREAGKSDMKELVAKFTAGSIGTEIEKACRGIYPLQNCVIRKVKVLKKPKFDITKLMELHSDAAAEAAGAKMARADEGAVPTMAGAGGRL
eukprot:CAMPEP_0197625302 /NCGR_PEP_ID=MMETSP1338-20131121/4695_1 /TAXON_ID=43686 ORGANISM="Pelagodinium beii, Strain RCC1491" /NCGR_SAMPLE_ID=MMETSP1338 /ASSEMBLY_ACC=CAM_ASM_000754 /LENGTH=263 /DNA_ID=CAMNT_0043195665 /DNA_START=46 /DNA_END=837 /DNA_ORIENTATION=+